MMDCRGPLPRTRFCKSWQLRLAVRKKRRPEKQQQLKMKIICWAHLVEILPRSLLAKWICWILEVEFKVLQQSHHLLVRRVICSAISEEAEALEVTVYSALVVVVRLHSKHNNGNTVVF
mmetsp:Transcript_73659/g.206783  ORF Transcript_73659/g.206783 Transcript_73659/m.206783 type:complete len:119 (-) Transcript_73659:143-499(-)